MGWLSSNWTYRRAIDIDNTAVAEDLIHFQVKVELSSANFVFSHAESDGSDIRITQDDGITLIPYYIAAYDDTGETAEIWVRVPYVAASSNGTIYMYYGNGSPPTFQQPPTGTFSRPATYEMDGLAENMVYDSVTEKYYIVFCDTPQGPISIASCATPDGTWVDEGIILNLGAATEWDDGIIYAPHLLKDGSTWYLFYSGSPTAGSDLSQVGYATATSILGTYTRYGSNPVLPYGGSGDFDEWRACEAFVYYSDILEKWVMLYMGDAGESGTEIEKVGYATATSIDGTWTKYASNPIIDWGSAPSFDSGLVADPFAYELDGVAYIGYTSHSNATAMWWATSAATTDDYVTFRKIGQVYGRGSYGRFDAETAFRGAWSYFNGKYYFPYTAYGGGSVWRWAVAEMDAASTVVGFDPLSVFEFYDHFDGATVDGDLWGVSSNYNAGTSSVSSSVLTLAITSGTSVRRLLASTRQFGRDLLLEVYCKHTTADGGGTRSGQIGLIQDRITRPSLRIHDYNNANWLKIHDNGTTLTESAMAQAISTNWVTQRIYFSANNEVKYQNDSGSWETVTTTIPTSDIYSAALSVFRGSQNVSMDVDYVIVRKYNGTDPTQTVGAESLSLNISPFPSFRRPA